MTVYPDFQPGADGVIFAPPEDLVDIDDLDVSQNPRRRAAARKQATRRKRPDVESEMTDEFKLFNGHDGLLVRTVLVRASSYGSETKPVTIRSLSDTMRLCRHMRYLDQEHSVVIALNVHNQVNAIFESAIGTDREVSARTVDILKVPMLTGCSQYVHLHNHPSGVARPSSADISVCEKLQMAGRFMGIAMLDDIVVGLNSEYSMLEHGYITPARKPRRGRRVRANGTYEDDLEY